VCLDLRRSEAYARVYLSVFDVDDSFDQINATMPNVGLIDTTPTSGPDNRPSGEAVQSFTRTTDSAGKASVTITVTMQPGNNYRAAASVIEEALTQDTKYNGVTVNPQQHADALSAKLVGAQWQRNGNFTGYSCPCVWSKMLTVWRKLHIETDSMQTEPTTLPPGTGSEGREPDWTSIYIDSITVGTTTTNVPVGYGMTSSSDHQYEGGRVEFDALPGIVFPVYDSGEATFDINAVLTPAQVTAILSQPYGTLKDDDPDAFLLPRFYAVDSVIKTVYRDAYIDIVNIPAALNPNLFVPFSLHLGPEDFSATNLFRSWDDAKDTWSSNGFWVSLVVAAYQRASALTYDRDSDPDPLIDNSTYPTGANWPGPGYSENVSEGVTPMLGDWDSVIFRATIVDFPQGAAYESRVIAHEIGHSAGNAGTEAQHHGEGGLQQDAANNRFNGASLKRFREVQKW